LRKANDDIYRAFDDVVSIDLRWAFVATWANVTYYHESSNFNVTDAQRNTFQLVLASDGFQRSYIIFYFGDIQWSTSALSASMFI
jgi:hypothetical protein